MQAHASGMCECAVVARHVSFLDEKISFFFLCYFSLHLSFMHGCLGNIQWSRLQPGLLIASTSLRCSMRQWSFNPHPFESILFILNASCIYFRVGSEIQSCALPKKRTEKSYVLPQDHSALAKK